MTPINTSKTRRAAQSAGTFYPRFGRFLAFMVPAFIALLIPPSANAAYYGGYNDVAHIPNAEDCDAAQGFAVGSSFCYSIKIKKDDTKAIIQRIDMSSGAVVLMTNGANGTKYCTYLGHANDMEVTAINGVGTMFVVTMKTGSLSFVKLQYSGSTYTKVGEYTLRHNGNNVGMSGVKMLNKTASTINFLFKSGNGFFTASIGLTANSGVINLTRVFTINWKSPTVNGNVLDLTDYVFQGFGYRNDRVYVPLTKGNDSVVLTYNNVSANISDGVDNTVNHDVNLSFRVYSNVYANLFEIESLGINPNNGYLYFNVNRKKTSGDTNNDAVCRFKDYVGLP
jgi:hypothetical protein